MKKVSNILARKGSSVFSIDGSTTVLDALKHMSDKNIGSIVITEDGDYAGSDVIDSNGLNNSMTIAQVLAIANTFLKTKVSASAYNYTA